jgi:hypothetical protein
VADGLPSGYSLVDMHNNLDIPLVHRFYNEIMLVNFPIADELDDVDVWIEGKEASIN